MNNQRGIAMAELGRRNMRGEERVNAALPVAFGADSGVTRDISASGILFETDATLQPGGAIEFLVDFKGPNGKMILKCSGLILRAETVDARTRVAVKIIESAMQVAE